MRNTSALYLYRSTADAKCECTVPLQVHPRCEMKQCTLYSQRESTAEHVRWSMAKAHARDAAKIRHSAQTRALFQKYFFCTAPPCSAQERSEKKIRTSADGAHAVQSRIQRKEKRGCNAGESDKAHNLSLTWLSRRQTKPFVEESFSCLWWAFVDRLSRTRPTANCTVEVCFQSLPSESSPLVGSL